MQKAVLLVEDNPEILLGLKDSLEMEGYVVFVAQSGGEALKKLHFLHTVLDQLILLSDIQMPNMTGVELAEAMRNDSKFNQIPIILMSALADAPPHFELLRKPFDIDTMLQVLARTVSHAVHVA